jgi:hypothetical protein
MPGGNLVFGRVDQFAADLTKLRYEASASISFGPNEVATCGIGNTVPE